MCFYNKRKLKKLSKPTKIKILPRKEYFLVRNFITGRFLALEQDDYYTGFGELAGATVFNEELYSYLSEEHKKDTHKVYIHILQ